jgi:NAD(P)-dependent dehydrogenase (short-subunit alcohol dehydrogenase family)
VVVSSGTHDPDTLEGKFNKPVFSGARQLAYPASEKEMTGMQRYATSKLANLMFAYELAERLKAKDITVNAFDPAAVPATNLLQSIKNPLLRSLLRFTTRFSALFGVRMSTPERSGGAMARLLLDSSLDGVTGKYFQILNEKRSSKESYNPRLAKELWEDSLVLTGLN